MISKTQFTRRQWIWRKPVAMVKTGVINPEFIEFVYGNHVFSQVSLCIQLGFVGYIAVPFHQSASN